MNKRFDVSSLISAAQSESRLTLGSASRPDYSPTEAVILRLPSSSLLTKFAPDESMRCSDDLKGFSSGKAHDQTAEHDFYECF